MHVLFLSSWYPNDKNPLEGNFVQNLAKAISLKNQVTVLFATSSNEVFQTYSINVNSETNFKEIIVYFSNHPNKIIKLYRKLRAYYIGYKALDKFDVIHANIFFDIAVIALLIKLISRKKIILTENSTEFLELSVIKRIKFRIFERFISVFAAPSEGLIEIYKKFNVNHNKLETVYNTIDTSIFDLHQKRESRPFTFVHVSQFSIPRKNVIGILDAYKQLLFTHQDIKLIIVGDGDMEWLKTQIAVRHISQQKIEVFSSQRNEDLARFYQNSDCFILNSFSENNPLVVLEAMSCGLPVISTNVGNISYMIHSENGMILSSFDSDELTHKMKAMIANQGYYSPEKIRKLIVDKISYNAVSDRFNCIYQKLIS